VTPIGCFGPPRCRPHRCRRRRRSPHLSLTQAALHAHTPIAQSYNGLANKTRTFFRAVSEAYDAAWVVKVDDDVYLMPSRLLLAQEQWGRMGAGYIGCMKHGAVWTRSGTRWFEPDSLLLGARPAERRQHL
jgi:hypothetical protein